MHYDLMILLIPFDDTIYSRGEGGIAKNRNPYRDFFRKVQIFRAP